MPRLSILAFAGVMLAGCDIQEPNFENHDKFPIDRHVLYPQYFAHNGQIAAGVTTGKAAALEQPLKFPHYTHATTLGMECEYCHSSARVSIHGGVPATETCMNCHKYVKTDAPEIIKLTALFNAGEPTPWKKVHDLPDWVVFSHKRHVQGGVQCTECHGQVALQGMPEEVTRAKLDANGAEIPDGNGGIETETVREVQTVMVRETTMQMGWCLDCHGSHPSIDKNYGEFADLRRAELKDCWTCHK